MVNKKATTTKEYIEQITDIQRKQDIETLDKLIRKATPKLEPYIQSGMLAYGPYHYKYASGREGDWCIVGLANQKNYISLYICAVEDNEYIAEKYKDKLPKASIGKSCIRFKKVSDIDLKVVEEILKRAEKVMRK